MYRGKTRRSFLNSMLAATAALNRRGEMFAAGSKRDIMLGLLSKNAPNFIPAAFFIHFDKTCHFGQAFPPIADIRKPDDWKKMPHYGLDFYAPELEAVGGLIKAAKKEALVLVTLYSPFMCAGHTASLPLLTAHLQEDPEPVRKGLETISSSLMLFVKECVRLGVDGFYASTQGGEAGRFRDPQIFSRYIKPFDLVLMNEINRSCVFNILHVCDYHAPYADLSPFLDYPGHVVNCNPQLTSRKLAWKEVAGMFKRPCMGGMDRHGIIASGSREEIRKAVIQTLADVTEPFVLGADCTLPNDIAWENIRTAISAAHDFKRG